VNTKDNFKGGNIQYFVQNWEKITSDETILSWVRGLHIDFEPGLKQMFIPTQRSFGVDGDTFVDDKVFEMRQKEVIQTSTHEDREIISTIFLVDKKDGEAFSVG